MDTPRLLGQEGRFVMNDFETDNGFISPIESIIEDNGRIFGTETSGLDGDTSLIEGVDLG